MFGNLFKSIKDFFSGPPLRTQFEEMVLQEELEKRKEVVPPPVVVDAVPTHGSHSKPVEDQITDAVTTKESKPKKPRAPRKKKESK